MIMIEDVDFSGFTYGLEGLIQELGIAAPKVVKHEVGELISTLVRVTPPNDMRKSRKAIDARVDNLFERAENVGGLISKHNSGGLIPYMVTPQFLFVVAPEKDMTKASTEELRKVMFTMTKKAKQHLPFRRYKRVQQVSISQNILTKPAQLTKLKAQLKRSFGRLKAGWCASFFAGVITIARGIPKYVARHAQGVRGRFTDGTSNKEAPYFEIGNSALGVEKTAYYLQKALNIRAKAMSVNTQLFFEGKKHLSDYAKRG